MTRKVILEDKDGEELVPYTELATNQQPGRVRPDGSSLVVNSNGVISVNGATGTEIGYLSGVTSGIQGQLGNTVHKTGNEDVSGEKCFRNIIYRQNPEDDYKTAPAERVATQIGIIDKNNNWLGGWEHYHHVDGSVTKSMAVRQQNGNSYAILGVGIKPDGTQYTFAPNPPTGDNSSNIATTSFVTNKVSTKADKASFQVVSALPANPDANTFYFIPE